MIQPEATHPAPNPATDIDLWLKTHAASMHTCSRLPGRPKVTRETCLRRQSLAREIHNRNGNESLFDGGGPVGLDTCLDCPDGAKD